MHQSQLSAKETLSRIDTVQVAERLFFALDSVAIHVPHSESHIVELIMVSNSNQLT